ncbi:MAG TPA: hypothetical protein DD412_00350 [Holosporales bacterium]|nr:hypothetical protein [Holosporales bacterium]
MTNLSDNTAPLEKETKTQKYLFDTEFSYSETSDDIQSITPKQLAAANKDVGKQSYNEGYEKGVKDTNEGIIRMAADQMFVITAKLEELIETEKGLLETFHVQVAQVCELIISKVMPTLLNQGAFEEIKGIIDKAYKSLPQDKKITINVHQSLVEQVTQHIKTFQENNDSIAQISVKSGENFEKSDCSISWDGAGIEHYSQSIIQEVTETLLRLSGKPLEDAPKAAEKVAEKNEEVIEEGNA